MAKKATISGRKKSPISAKKAPSKAKRKAPSGTKKKISSSAKKKAESTGKKKAPSTVKEPENSHGGAIAIAGYVYQVLATTKNQITAEKNPGGNPNSSSTIYVHEALDQDAVGLSSLTKKVQLIQVKYSSLGTQNQITLGEARAIAKTLLTAANRAIKESLKVTGYELLSNRGLSAEAKAEIASLRKARKKAFEPGHPNADGILAELKEGTFSEATVRKGLEDFGKTFGLKTEEIEVGISQLVGEVFSGVARNMTHSMSREGLIKVFTGNGDAHPLDRPSMGDRLKAELVIMTGGSKDSHTPREHMRDLLDANPYRALFVFLGPGGMGKSASLQYLVERQIASPEAGLLRAAKGSGVPIHWAAKCVDDWRGNSRFISPNFHECLERLQIANTGVVPPILTLALDAIDEGVRGEHKDYIRALIRDVVAIDRESRKLAGTRPKVRLIVTCREEAELTDYLDKTSSGYPKPEDKDYRPVDFGAFTQEEFRTVVKGDAPGFIDSIFDDSVSGGYGLDSLGGGGISATSRVHKYLEFLQDPLIWRAFTLLDNDEDRNSLLNGTGTGDVKLGLKLLERFLDKTVERCRWKRPKDILKVLKFVAKEFQNKPQTLNRANWLAESAKLGILNRDEQELLFEEALSGGLITGAAALWEWRHRFIEKALEV